jgi:hypothetical protein
VSSFANFYSCHCLFTYGDPTWGPSQVLGDEKLN